MSETPPSGPMPGHGTSGFPAAPTGFQSAPPAWQPAPPKEQSRGLTYVALAIALIATVLAIVGWFRPTPPPPPQAHPSAPTYTEQQIADAKAKACSAFELVDKGVVLQTGGGNPRPEPSKDPVMAEARAADARLSLAAGSWYLRDHLDPATAPKLASAIRNYATILANLAQNYLAGIKDADPAQESLLKDSDEAFTQLHEMCQ